MSTAVLDKAPPPAPGGGPIQAGGGNAMRRVSTRGLMAHKMRFILTLLAVTLGTAFIAGSFVLTRALGNGIDGIVGGIVQNADVVVTPKSGAQNLPLSLENTLRKVPDAAAVQPEVDGYISLVGSNGKVVATGAAPTQGLGWVEGADNATADFELTGGHKPQATNEVAINEEGLKKSGLKVGDTARVSLPKKGLTTVKVVGSFNFDFSSGSYVAVAFTPSQARSEFLTGGGVNGIYLRAKDGVSQDKLLDEVTSVLPQTAEAQTQKQYKDESNKQVASNLTFVTTFLLAFGIIGLVVGASLIYITFSMVIAQRLRELALLRAIGAGRGQILRSVLVEGFLVGLIGSVMGVFLGWLLGWGMMKIVGTMIGLPLGSALVPLNGIIAALVLGTAVTVLSAIAPAVRAGATSPIEAMGGQFATPRIGKLRIVAAVLLTVLVVALTLLAVASRAKAVMGLAAFLALPTMLVLSPLLAPIVMSLFRPLTGRTPVGRLAHGNTIRNPKRTAATAAALALGLALISAANIVAASTKATLTDSVTKGQKWEYVVTNQQQRPLAPYLIRSVQKAAGDGATLGLTFAQLPLDGQDELGNAVVGNLGATMDVQMISGSDDLGPNTLLVNQSTAKDRGWKVGDKVAVNSPSGVKKTLTVGGIMENGGPLDPFAVTSSFAKEFTPAQARQPATLFVTPAAGQSTGDLRAALDRATANDPFVTVQDRKAYIKSASSFVNILLGILYGLLALAVAISILGIINTLALSVVERVRELGMMRAIGAQRSQIRRMVTVESVMICVYGALVGLGLGTLFGWLFMGLLKDNGLTSRVIPWGQLGLFFLAAVLVGLVAAVWPAFKAARTKPLDAIAEG